MSQTMSILEQPCPGNEDVITVLTGRYCVGYRSTNEHFAITMRGYFLLEIWLNAMPQLMFGAL